MPLYPREPLHASVSSPRPLFTNTTTTAVASPTPRSALGTPIRRLSDAASDTSSTWSCLSPRDICPLPPTVSVVTAHRTRRTPNPGVYICKGEGHLPRHSWIVAGRLVEFPFPETPLGAMHPQTSRKPNTDEVPRPPIPIPASVSAGPSREGSVGSSDSF